MARPCHDRCSSKGRTWTPHSGTEALRPGKLAGTPAPPAATPVVFHSAVLTYLPADGREVFSETMRRMPGHWISNEAPHVLPTVQARLPRPALPGRAVFALALDEQPVAFSGPHGQSLDWF
ncbi:DUF2332 family protein [Streptomyces sp. ACA25]|uniref:DUF2332 family protein n=1 Tax=Streptomyces sp. ACA25 TaxID=3022596 RepID=UPI002306F447|nr:DUF2332 family protein [Streptomyces sp. ACA25]MDB1086226.1 DUF2332 family protein [Streptomyces sp. ACA25]